MWNPVKTGHNHRIFFGDWGGNDVKLIKFVIFLLSGLKKENPPRMLMRWVRQSFGFLHVIEGKGWLFSSINDFCSSGLGVRHARNYAVIA